MSILNGKIECCRGADGGCCFRVCLPGAVGPRKHSETQIASELYSSMLCLISVRDDLSKSLQSMLARLGVEARSIGQKGVDEADFDQQILITEPQIFPADSSCQNGLQFTHKAPAGRLPSPRRLQAPFFESTLGPLLMEMSLEWRMAERASTPTRL